MRPRPRAMGVRVLDAHHHRVRDLARSRGPALVADVTDDDRAVAETELRAVVLADPHALDEAKRRARARRQPPARPDRSGRG